MMYRILADLVVLIHLTFIVFVVVGGFFVWKRPMVIWAHVPAAVWGATLEFAGWGCPLTPLENRFRRLAGGAGYEGGFVEHYVIPVIYPDDWTVELRLLLGGIVLVVNAVAYGVYFGRLRTRRERSTKPYSPTRPTP